MITANRPGLSSYPIAPGRIFRIHKTIKKKNVKAGSIPVDHIIFLWIHTVGPVPKMDAPKARMVNMVRVEIPANRSLRHAALPVKKTRVQFDYVRKLMSDGYAEIGSARWNYSISAWRGFYRIITKNLNSIQDIKS
jgi:hypothetical protein